MAIGISGPQEDSPRSDLRVEFEPKDSGGVQIHLDSKVAPYYGEAIETQIKRLLASLGVEHGRFSILDGGALPFTIEARVECAIRDSGIHVGPGDWAPVGDKPPSPKNRMRVSRLYVPGNQPKLFPNIVLHGADGIILDLEDSVHPDEKNGARFLVRNALGALDWRPAERMVRINQLPLGLKDLEAIVPARPNLILVPKVEHPDQIKEVEQKIVSLQSKDFPIWIMPILESALGMEHAFEIASASPSVAALTIGLEDYTADLGVEKTLQGDESLWARRRLVNAAKAAGVQAIDSVFGDIENLEALAAYVQASRAMGFTGMGCVHPRQIPVIHQHYAPTPEAIAKAKRIVEAYEEATAKGLGVVSLGSKMIDPPVVERAQKLIAQARQMGLLDEEGIS